VKGITTLINIYVQWVLKTICFHSGRTFSCVIEHCCCHGRVIE